MPTSELVEQGERVPVIAIGISIDSIFFTKIHSGSLPLFTKHGEPVVIKRFTTFEPRLKNTRTTIPGFIRRPFSTISSSSSASRKFAGSQSTICSCKWKWWILIRSWIFPFPRRPGTSSWKWQKNDCAYSALSSSRALCRSRVRDECFKNLHCVRSNF